MTKQSLLLLLFLLCQFSLFGQRDPLTWPFADTSIWNMPIGTNAVYVPAGIEPVTKKGMTVDEDLIVMSPNAPLLDIYTSFADWDQSKNRCIAEGPILFAAPIPDSFIVSPDNWDGLTPNSGLAVLMPDGQTIKQTQPFARCIVDTATSHYTPPDVDLFGPGIRGAHGGSGLSAIGGTLRLGELDDVNDTIRHALKVNVFAAKNLFYDGQTEGYRWPAIRADGYAPGVYGSQRTTAIVTECRMGALLALPQTMILDSLNLETIPAKILAQAFQCYGAYIVDDTAWDVYALITEWSPNGRFIDEFEAAWGFPFKESSLDTPWTRDMAKIFAHLHVVDNNGPGNIGGGGTPLKPLAPAWNTTSVEPIQSLPGTWFPNPAQSELRWQTESASERWQVRIFDLQGRLQLKWTVQGNATFNLESLRPGLYLLQMENEQGQIYTDKLQKF